MPKISPGARQLPMRHVSIRVPWHDTDWTGKICQNPANNISCLVLPRIRESRQDNDEAAIAGQSWEDLDEQQLPPCVSERGGFMAPYEFSKQLSHPYSKGGSEPHQRYQPTRYRFPAYSAPCLPFSWMLKGEAESKVEHLELGFEAEREDNAHALMNFETEWIQDRHNQLVMLDTFFSAIQPKRSLCFFYAKRTPLVEDTRRVIIGVGWVNHIGNAVEYEYSEPGPLRSVIWERPVQHSIRPGFSDGFLLPYHDVLAYLQESPAADPTDYLAFAPNEHFWAFSYASEHVTNDAAIASLLACAKALENIQKIVPGRWEDVQKWINQRLNELWRMRGPFPGLGAALTAFGMQKGALLAYDLEIQMAGNKDADPWPIVDALFRDSANQPTALTQYLSPSLQRKWASLPDERRALLKLLSRFELTSDQAIRYYVHEDKSRAKLRRDFSDAELLANPYLLYEFDRDTIDPINLPIIDRGLFPEETLRKAYPLPEPSKVDDATDERRVRAFVVRQLEWAALEGHTLQPQKQIVSDIRDLEVQPPCTVDGDLIATFEKAFVPTITLTVMADENPAYQLERLSQTKKLISRTVNRRLKAKLFQSQIDWRTQLDQEFNGPAPADDLEEQAARQEKTTALEQLFGARFSVLIGPAGTGKTTLLKVLCRAAAIKTGGVLLLAPTGKARVRLEEQTEIRGAQTIAQFLLPLDRYNHETGTYRLSTKEKIAHYKTVIIDEASMLTEEQLAAVFDALTSVDRFILVGDPKQLPPIGAGRPFLDIVTKLAPPDVETAFPKIATGYAELTVRRRQQGENRDDLLLAEWFSGRPLDPGADEIWSSVSEDNPSDYLRLVEWDQADDLREKLLETVASELALNGVEDCEGFELKLGGSKFKNFPVNFWAGRSAGEAGACASVEDWQILSPMRNEPHGVEAINRLIQTTFRQSTKQRAVKKWDRKVPKPVGREEIIYGDKVINLQNHRRYGKRVYPKDGALEYIANGEIGVIVGQYKTKYITWTPRDIEVEFSTQPGFKYTFRRGEFREEGEPKLELAYALTVHKVQGSEFGFTILIVPNPCRLLSRELLYTALTRQKNRVIIFHQGDRHKLKDYTRDEHSEALRRLTNLFEAPKPVQTEAQESFMEERLIHRTRRGHSVQSKSEVIIADLLYSKDEIDEYRYELKLIGKDGTPRYPDFFFEDSDLGIKYYWEHLGMLHKPDYKARWERKLAWYRENGILPYEEGGGENGTLITTRDDEQGGIQSNEIEQLLDEILGI